MREFSECSHRIILAARQEAQQMAASGTLGHTLCSALVHMAAECGGGLAACFAAADQEQMIQLQVVQL